MKKELKELWISELKSVKWKKCEGSYTEGNDRYCAVGVLAELTGIGARNEEEYIIEEVSAITELDEGIRVCIEKFNDGFYPSFRDKYFTLTQPPTFDDVADFIEEVIECTDL